MMENMDSIITFGSQKKWLLCQNCENYYCVECYQSIYEINDADLAADLKMYSETKFLCSTCRSTRK